MKPSIFKLGLLGCLAWLALALPLSAKTLPGGSDPSENEAKRFVAIVVNGRTLIGPNSSAQQIGGRLLIPVANVAASLGDVITIDPGARSVTVRRQTGVMADFDARLGQVRENGARILSVSTGAEIVFTGDPNALLLPAEVVSSLLDVAIRFDTDRDSVQITRGRETPVLGVSGHGRRPFELFQLDYEYGLDRYLLASSQNLSMNALGRLGDGRFTLTSSAFLASSRKLSLQTATFRLERANGQRFVAGDLGTGTDLQFFSTAMRGGSAAIPVKNFTVTAFGGRSYSGTLLPIAAVVIPVSIQPQQPIVNRPHFDTNVYGVFATSDSAINGRGSSPWGFAGGGMHFDSANRHGELASGSVSYRQRRFELAGEFAAGNFSGLRADGSAASGTGTAIDLSGTFQASDELAFQGRYTNVSRNFLSPQAGLREPVAAAAAGVTWSPRKWLSTSFSASSTRRTDDSSQRSRSFTAALAITPRPRLPQFSLTHTQSDSSLLSSSAFTMLTASKDFSRLRVFVNATRAKLLGVASLNAQAGASYALNDSNSLELSQGFSDKGAYNGQFDWRGSNLLWNHLDLSAGGGYDRDQTQKLLTFARFSAGVRLPRETSLQLNYVQTAAGSTLLLSLRGTLFRKRGARTLLDSSVAEINSYSKISGRVYQDIDLDGKFDPAVDKPQAGVKVRVDSNRYVLSGEDGAYTFDAIVNGAHTVSLDLLSVRADLTFIDRDTRDMTVTAERESVSDFRLVRTGRISGRVWMDANEDGKFDEGELPLGDVRVVTASGRDTLTDNDGYFTIGDLPPGDHVVLIDEKTLPEKMTAELKPIAIRTLPGKETGDVKLPVALIPAEVKRFGTRASK
jgi:hypothetical protein